MKKIVALVLSLVMVLGLATTAFAAPTPAYLTDDEAGLTVNTGLVDLAGQTYTLEPYTAGAAAAKLFDNVAVWATNKVTGAKVMVEKFVVAVSAESADYAFVDGANITYLNRDVAYNGNAYAGAATAYATTKVADVDSCGDVFAVEPDGVTNLVVYTNAAGAKFYESANGTAYNVDGKLVELAPLTNVAYVTLEQAEDLTAATIRSYTLYTVKHTYAADTTTVAGKTAATKVFCKECKAEFAFVAGDASDAIAKFGAGNYVDTEINVTAGDVFVSVVPGAAAPEAGATEKVESAETFDAGIAMYVGMSVMAAAGSAVVLKKKD